MRGDTVHLDIPSWDDEDDDDDFYNIPKLKAVIRNHIENPKP